MNRDYIWIRAIEKKTCVWQISYLPSKLATYRVKNEIENIIGKVYIIIDIDIL